MASCDGRQKMNDFEFGDVVRMKTSEEALFMVLGIAERDFRVDDLLITTDETDDNIIAEAGKVIVITVKAGDYWPIGFIDAFKPESASTIEED